MLLCPNPKCGDIGKSINCSQCGYTRVPVPEEGSVGNKDTNMGFSAGINDDKSTSYEELIQAQSTYETSGATANKQRLQPDICNFCQRVLVTGSRFCQICGGETQCSGITGLGNMRKAADDVGQIGLDGKKQTTCTANAGVYNPFYNKMLLCPNPECGDNGESTVCLKCGFKRIQIPGEASTGNNDTDVAFCAGINDDKSTPYKELIQTGSPYETSGSKADKQRLKPYICDFCQCVLETESRFCHKCGGKTQLSGTIEVVLCGGIKDDRSTCNEEVKSTQNFCKTCGAKVDKQRFKPDICKFCRCVLTSGSGFCHICGANTEGLGIVGTEKKAVDDLKQLSLDRKKEAIYTPMAGACNVIPEHIELSENDTKSGPGLSADEVNRMKNAVQGGILTFQEYLKAKNNEWKHIPLHIAVTGNSGVGKSSFINALRGVRKGQKGFAEVNVTETTTDLKGYPHPQNKSLVFWDMPGVGTPKYPKKDYLKAVSFEKYDFFLILTCGRFTENDLWLANQVRSQEKMFYFIRTKIGFDVYNEQRNDPKMHESGITLRIRDDCIRKLKKANFGNPSVFLIDNYDIVKYDFGRLVDTLLTHLPEKKREALALSLTVMTKEVILAKRHALRKRIVVISFASALGGAIPFPGLGATIDTVLIYEEAQEYKRQFGLTEDALLKSNPKYAQLIKDKYVQNIAQLVATVTIDEAAENAVKFGLPILGSILSGTVSYGVSVTVLWRLLNSMADDAIDLNEDMITGLSSDTGV